MYCILVILFLIFHQNFFCYERKISNISSFPAYKIYSIIYLIHSILYCFLPSHERLYPLKRCQSNVRLCYVVFVVLEQNYGKWCKTNVFGKRTNVVFFSCVVKIVAVLKRASCQLKRFPEEIINSYGDIFIFCDSHL